MDSPRGRIYLMKGVDERKLPLNENVVAHFDRCLGCMACVTACPSGVQYDALLEQTRPELERRYARTPADRAFRRLCFELFTHPDRLRALVPILVAGRRLGLDRRLRHWLERQPSPDQPTGGSDPSPGGATPNGATPDGDGGARRFRRLAAMMGLTPEVKLSAAWHKLPERTPAQTSAGPTRGAVGLL